VPYASNAGIEPLLPTPCAQQSGNTPENHLLKKPGRKVVTDLAILVENGLIESGGALLPTPRSSDCFGAGLHGDGGMDLRTTVTLLPTPLATAGTDGPVTNCKSVQAICDGSAGRNPRLSEMAAGYLMPATAWGKYEPAIRRWESLTRPAPAPTEPNKNGNPRLSAAFSEWLMGWPAGWVTDPAIGISRNDQLRIVGNGVVSIQAAAAMRQLLAVAC
jgi:DNA (cytosine-5)-methyltransferase 1